MKQIIQNVRNGELRVVDVPAPTAQPGHALIRTAASLISAGTERMVVDFAQRGLVGKAQARPDLVRKVIDKARRDGIAATLRSVRARLDEPLPLGYSATGTIVELGAGLEGRFQVGQRVAMAGAGVANHAELNLVPENLLVPVPHDVRDEEAACVTLAAIALHGIRNLKPGLGDVVVVVGAGLVGLIAVRLLGLAGARVVAVDLDAGRLDMARRLGAELAVPIQSPGAAAAVAALTNGRGADGVLVAAASDDNGPLVFASQAARDRATVSIIGKTGTEFPFADYMKKELSIVVSRSYGPGRYDSDFEGTGVKYPPGFVRWTETENLAECARLMSPSLAARLDLSPLITHRFDIADAEKAYDLVLHQREPALGIIITYPPAAGPAKTAAIHPPRSGRAAAGAGLGVIGAGPFARSVLLPILKSLGVQLRTVVTARGATGEQVRQAFAFGRAATDAQAIFDDPEIGAVIVATPHDTHARLTAAALAAGKAVFVEKPLALDRAELADITRARSGAGRFFTVGFNRRFAPYTQAALTRLAGLRGRKLIAMRINAGPPPAVLPAGGRILGEMCHFVDLARCLAGAPIVSVRAVAPSGGGACDDVAATLEFADGSVASIVYTGLGDASGAKELIEIFCAGTVITIADFRTLTIVADGRTTTEKNRTGQDKGHRRELAAFIAAARDGGPGPIDEVELIETSLATIAVLESLRSGGPVRL